MSNVFQELINRWVHVNRSHYGVSSDRSISPRKLKARGELRIIPGEERTAVTTASTVMPSNEGPSNAIVNTMTTTGNLTNVTIDTTSRSELPSNQGHGKDSIGKQNERKEKSSHGFQGPDKNHPSCIYHHGGSSIRTPRFMNSLHIAKSKTDPPVLPLVLPINGQHSHKNHQNLHSQVSSSSHVDANESKSKSKSKRSEKSSSRKKDKLSSSTRYSATKSSKRTLRRTHSQSDLLKEQFDEKEKEENSRKKHQQKRRYTSPYMDEMAYGHQMNPPFPNPQHGYPFVPNPTGRGDPSRDLHQDHRRFSRMDLPPPLSPSGHPPCSDFMRHQPHSHYSHHSPPHQKEEMNAYHPDKPMLAQARQQEHHHHMHHPKPAYIRDPLPSPPHLPCKSCLEMEKKLMMMQSDIEYLRSIALNNENTCASCHNSYVDETDGINNQDQFGSYGGELIRENASLLEGSQRIVDLTARHQQQIEQMAKERARWQNDMHLKLSKFALLCKELNEESAKRKQDHNKAQEELAEITDKHSSVTMELELLRAKVSLYEQELAENKEIRESLVSRDNDLMDRVDGAIQKRDSMITELSIKMETTLNTLELERYQQRQRRQIIFPTARHNQLETKDTMTQNFYNENQISSPIVKTLSDRLHHADDALKIAEKSLRDASEKASRREEELQKKCARLAMELKEAEIIAMSSSGAKGKRNTF